MTVVTGGEGGIEGVLGTDGSSSSGGGSTNVGLVGGGEYNSGSGSLNAGRVG